MSVAKVNGINMNYKVEGQGEPLVMIMGFQISRIGWMFQTRFFKKHYQVITFDNRGVGKSDKPNGSYSIRMMADDTIGLTNHLRIKKAYIVGESMGGDIAQEIAINYPDRVAKIVMVGAWADNSGESGCITPEMKQVMQLHTSKMKKSMLNLAMNKRIYRFIFIPLMELIAKRQRPSSDAGILGQRDACLRHNTKDRLNLISCPVLIIAGTKDRCVVPKSSEVISSLIPNSKLLKINEGSHVPCLEMTGKFNKEVLNFLKSG